MAYRDKERAKEYQKQYYQNRTKLRRLRGEIKASTTNKNAYKKMSPEAVAESRRQAGIKAAETLRERLGEEGYKEMMTARGKRGMATLKSSGKPFGFQLGHASEAGKLGAKARGLKSKHKKVREKYGTE